MSKYTNEEFIQAVSESFTYSDVCRKIGINPRGGNLNTVKKKIEELGIDDSHFIRKNKVVGFQKKKDISELLIENSNRTSSCIRKRLIDEGIKEYKCECCGNTEWLGGLIPLELHHINGNHQDNRLENLIILCPNCHALTDSHAENNKLSAAIEKQQVEGRKIMEVLTENFELKQKLADDNHEPSLIKKEGAETIHVQPKSKIEPKYCQYCGKELFGRARQNKYCSLECSHLANGSKRPDVLTLLNDFEQYKTFTAVGQHYGVTDNAVRKWCKLYGILDKVKRQSRPQTDE